MLSRMPQHLTKFRNRTRDFTGSHRHDHWADCLPNDWSYQLVTARSVVARLIRNCNATVGRRQPLQGVKCPRMYDSDATCATLDAEDVKGCTHPHGNERALTVNHAISRDR
jgi:hypothetical protein